MTFGLFLLFLLIPILILASIHRKTLKGYYVATVLGVAVFSVLYTTAWDEWLIVHNVWWFDWSRCWGLAVGVLPVEELLFYMLIITLGGMWTHAVYQWRDVSFSPAPKRPQIKYVGALLVAAAWVLDAVYLKFFTESFPKAVFLAQCLIITLPALCIQWLVCGDLLWHRRTFALMATVPVGLWLTITAGTSTFGTDMWTVNPAYSFWRIPGLLPIEMVLFYQFAAALIVLPATTIVEIDENYFREPLQKIQHIKRSLLGAGSQA